MKNIKRKSYYLTKIGGNFFFLFNLPVPPPVPAIVQVDVLFGLHSLEENMQAMLL
jgi:hypothetical protein